MTRDPRAVAAEAALSPLPADPLLNIMYAKGIGLPRAAIELGYGVFDRTVLRLFLPRVPLATFDLYVPHEKDGLGVITIPADGQPHPRDRSWEWYQARLVERALR